MVGKRKRESTGEGKPNKFKRLAFAETPLSTKNSKEKSFSGKAVSAVTVDDDTVSFPRGGQDTLTPLEKRAIHQQVKQDILFSEDSRNEPHDKPPPKKRAKHSAGVTDSQVDKRPKLLNIMNAKKLLPGALILGAVLEVHEFEVVFSLPFNMKGSAAISDVSDQLSQKLQSEVDSLELEEDEEEASSSPGSSSLSSLFTRGQLMTCCVVSVGGGRVSLSVNPRLTNAHLTPGDIRPGMILPGAVKSIEDHGYIINFSIKGKTGFLLKRNASELLGGKRKSLSLGQVLSCVVLSGADARAVPVSVNPSQVGGALLPGDTLIGLNALIPGILVNAAVREVGSNGLLMSFLGGFEGTVSVKHLPTRGEFSTDKYHPKKKYKARILWVDVATKTAGLTLQTQIIAWHSHSFEGVDVGDSFSAAKVIHIDFSKGLYLELGSDIIGYAPGWMLSDEKERTPQELTKSTHRCGTLHPCRVVQFNLLDGFPIVSLQQSVLEKPYMRYADLSVGEIVQGKVERFGEFGMIVGLTDTMRGLVLRTHLSDTRAIIKQPRKKYKEGSKVKARVLSVEPAQNRLLLTCKKSLVRGCSEPLTCYTQVTPGSVQKGVVQSVRGFGLIIGFFNGVRGLVLKSELGLDRHVSDLSTVFWVGQPVECRVLECDPAQKRLLLSLRVDAVAAVSMSEETRVMVGSSVSAEVTGIASNGVNLKCTESGEVLFLSTLHLSDYPFHCAHLLSQHQTQLVKSLKKSKAYELNELLVLSERAGYKPAQVTLKKTLQRYSREAGFLTQFTDFKVGTVQPGVVKRLMPYGCFVEFPHHLSGLAPTKYLTDEFVSGPAGLYQETQTVWCKVMQVDEDNGKLLLSLRPSDLKRSLSHEEDEVSSQLLAELCGYLQERGTILKELAKSSGSVGASLVKAYIPGSCVIGHVTSVGDHVIIDLENHPGVIGRASLLSANGVSLETGDEVRGVVVDVDLVECCLVVSLNQQLLPVERSSRVLRSASKRKSVSGGTEEPLDSQEATLEHKTSYYCVLSYSNGPGHRLAYGVMDSGQLGVLPPYFKNLKVGQKISTTTISRVGEEDSLTLPVLLIEEPSVKTSEAKKQSLYDVKAGDIIDVKVHSVKPTQLDIRYHIQKGRIHATLLENTEKDSSDSTVSPSGKAKSVLRDVKAGDTLRARVVKVKSRQITGFASRKGATLDVLELTTKPSLMDPSVDLDADALLKKAYSAGEQVAGVITQVKENGLQVALNPRAEGFVPIMLTSQSPDKLLNLKMHYTRGQTVTCTVLGCEPGKGHIHNLSMIGQVEPSEGDIVFGRVYHGIPGQALLVSTLYGNGRVDITDVSDHYTDDPLSGMVARRACVRCCLVGMADGKLDFSLRVSRTGVVSEGAEPECEEDPEIESLSDLSKGQVVRGYVKAVTDVGVFVRLGRSVDGRVKITHLCDGFIKNFKKHFPVGKLVKAKVLEIDAVKGKVDLSLRLSHVDPEAAKKARKKQEKEKRKSGEKRRLSTSDGESVELESDESSSEEEVGVASDSDESEKDDESLTSDDDDEGQRSIIEDKPTLRLSGEFRWDVGVVSNTKGVANDSSDSEMEVDEPAPKKTRRQKKAAQRAEEAHLYHTEQTLLTEKKEPETPDDFDRLLLASPNDSALWVKYMSFYLHTTEVDKARSTAQRALKTIEFREEREKLNVWVAWMNLENLYGSQESLVKVFESALQENDPLEVFSRLVTIYQQSDKFELAEQLYQSMVKRFSSNPEVWTQYGEFLMRRGKRESARDLLQRSLKSLARKQDQLQVIRKFALFEFKHGEAERGRTMFESLLSTYPRRVDIWSTYIDQMIKLGDTAAVRNLFERVIHLSVSAQKMKFLFKRYLDFEEKFGTVTTVESVKAKAREYVETRTKQKVT